MSSASLPIDKQPSSKSKTFAAKAHIDSSCARFTNLIPDYPYILGVPDFDLPYSKRAHDLALEESRWLRDSPFSKDEAHLQYMTFMLRDTSDSCFELRTQVDQDREKRMKELERNGTTAKDVGAGTPKVGQVKKKISLAAYKEKKEKGYLSESKPSPESDKPSPSEVTGTSVAPTARVNGHVNKDESSLPAITKIKNEKPAVQVLSHKTTTEASKKRKSPEPEHVISAPSTKKSRPNTPVPKQVQSEHKSSSLLSSPPSNPSAFKSRKDHGLPPLLSPGTSKKIVLPPLHSPPAIDSGSWIPPLLSPTIDPQLEEELRKLKARSRADSDLSSLSDPHSSKYPTPSKPEKSFPTKTSSSDLRDVQHISKNLHRVERAGSDNSEVVLSKESEKTIPQKRLLVRLKFGKKGRSRLESIFKQSPKSSRPVLGPAFAEQPMSKPKLSSQHDEHRMDRKASPEKSSKTDMANVDRKASKNAPESSNKRVADPIPSDQPLKKPRPAALSNGVARKDLSKLGDQPITPVQDEFAVKKNTKLVTPKDASTAMARTASNNSHLSTPRNLTPLPPPRATNADSASKAASSNSNSKLGRQIAALAECSKQFNATGRAFKHNAQKMVAEREKSPESAKKQAAIVILESVMSYMIAYTYQDYTSRLRKQQETYQATWFTLHAYIGGISYFTKPFPELEGLRHWLSYVIAHKAIDLMIASLAAAAQVATAPSPSVASATDQHHSPAESNNPAQPPPLDDQLPQRLSGVHLSARNSISEAVKLLPDEAIAKRFPQTWSAREQKTPFDVYACSKQEREDMLSIVSAGESGGKLLRGPFWLPIITPTTPIQAVRFGVVLCTEWMKREGIKYEIGLSKIK